MNEHAACRTPWRLGSVLGSACVIGSESRGAILEVWLPLSSPSLDEPCGALLGSCRLTLIPFQIEERGIEGYSLDNSFMNHRGRQFLGLGPQIEQVSLCVE